MAAARPDTRRFGDLPVISSFRINDKIDDVVAILREHDYGVLARSAALVDEVLTDDRCAGVVGQRVSGLRATPLVIEAAGDRRKEIKIADELGGSDKQSGTWRMIIPPDVQAELLTWGFMLGVGVAEIVWNRTPRAWTPTLRVWHPQFLRFDWMQRRFMLQSMTGLIALPRPDEQPQGDGKWFVWCPYGYQYGWRRSIIRSLALKYISRTWNERDWDRHNEKLGLAIIKGTVPAGTNTQQDRAFEEKLNNLGNEPTIVCPGPPTKEQTGYNVELVESVARTWESMKERKSALDADIAVLVLGQNLTTEVQGGSRAAAQEHTLVRLDKLCEDAAIGPALRQQVLMPWAWFNYGDPEFAPWPTYQVEPPEDENAEALALKTLGEAVQALQAGSTRVDVDTILEEAGVPLISEEEAAAIDADEAAAAAERMAAMQQQGGGGEGGEPGAARAPAPGDGTQPNALSAVVRRRTFAGLSIAIENPAGSIRLWPGPNGTQGATKMQLDYGFIEGHMGGDGEEVDCYLGPHEDAPNVYVVHQLKAPDYRGHDEDKVMLGFTSEDQAVAAYVAHRSDGDRAIGGVSRMPVARFKTQLRRRGEGATGKIRASADLQRALLELANGRQRVALRRNTTGRKRALKYDQRLTKNAQAIAARALAPDLAAIKEEVDQAESFADLKKRLLKRCRGMDPTKLAAVLAKTNVLARLSGKQAALEDV